MITEQHAEQIFDQSLQAINQVKQDISPKIATASIRLAECFTAGNKILICGNGGSASDALHFSSELLNKYHTKRRPLAAISLTADTSTITSIANDESYEQVFSKQVEAYGKPGDILIPITSSGNSGNLLMAVDVAHNLGMTCIALNGKDGGLLSPRLRDPDIDIRIPLDSTARIQEIHGIIIHAFCQFIDQQLFPGNQP